MAVEKFLNDKTFLQQLDNLRVKSQYVRLTVLSWDEEPLNEIQGKAIQGSLSLDGSSTLRRTANFTMFAEEADNDLTRINTELSINRKVKLEFGYKNDVPTYMYDTRDEYTNKITHHFVDYKKEYGNIVWFPLGIYIIMDPNIQHQVGTGATIGLKLEDKMALLNGDAGGRIPASVTFSEVENEYGVIEHPTLRRIIFELVNHFGAEAAAKVVIEDLDEQIKQVMQYIGGNPIYYVEKPAGEDTFRHFYLTWDEALSAAGSADYIKTFSYGQDVGFVMTDFIYPGELVCSPGDAVTDVLDEIIKVIGNYEYFYDVYGVFHFQEIKNYLNTTYTTTVLRQLNSDVNYEVDFSTGRSVYTFEGTKLITATANTPLYSNVRNDYVVWGVRKVNDTEVPIRYHLAIDHRPEIGQEHYVNFYEDRFGVTRAGAEFTFTYKKKEDLPEQGGDATLYIVGPLKDREYYRWNNQTQQYYPVTENDCKVVTKDWREELYYQGIESQDTGSATPYYYAELLAEWPKLFNLRTQEFYDSVKEDPSTVDFWLDMIDDAAMVGQYSVDSIGRRSEVVSEDEINCVFEQEVPDLIFINIDEEDAKIEERKKECDAIGQDWIQVDDTVFSLLTVGGSQNSCYARICDLLYQHTTMNETISITALPLYYLEPNTRITVSDEASGINGDYMIRSINLPLTVEGTMTISAYKCLQKI